MTSEKLKELRDNNKIVVVADKLGLIKRQINLDTQTTCCIHCPNTSKHSNGDHEPSLALLPRVNRFKCYGPACGEKGDVINLVQITLGLSFQEAIKWLDPNAELISPNHQVAKNYLKEKGFTQETIDKFRVWIGKTRHEDVEYECIYFPIPTGKKYRLFGCPEHKYKNGVGAGASIFKTIDNPSDDLIIFCEGEIDAMIGWQFTKYPFWTSTGGAGTFEESWVTEFKRFNQIVIAFDNDEAGKIGSGNAIKTLIDGGIDKNKIVQIEVLEMWGKDWCDFFAKGFTKKDFDEVVTDAKNTQEDLPMKCN
ncbi:MAG: toprim domain-containing protein [Candidatus Shapirobacteria bacterium]|nr:toprim domain-containing protein [Candidatus Shapirobacteria bacterium]